MLVNVSNAKMIHDNLRQLWFWGTSPVVEICPGSPIGEKEVTESIEFWRTNKVFIDVKSITYVDQCDFEKLNVIQITGDISIPKTSIAITI